MDRSRTTFHASRISPTHVILAVGSGAASSAIYALVYRNKHRAVLMRRADGLEVEVSGHSEDEERRIIRDVLGDGDDSQ
ncbi:hypothetical protein JCM10369A_28540 [Nocardioides pyridinolyticus]